MPKPKKVLLSHKEEAPFSVSLKVNDVTVVGSGSTMLEAIDNIPFVLPKTKGIFTASSEGKSVTFQFPAFQTKRILTTKLLHEVWAKRFSVGMK